LQPGNNFLAPELIWVEGANVLGKKARLSQITHQEAFNLPQHLERSPVKICPNQFLLNASIGIAIQEDRSVCDSLYVSLAVARKCQLITADTKLFNALKTSPYDKYILSLHAL
jgi:predicted nucleic acid-binding protein